MSTSSQLSFAIQLHELDWQDFSATLATLPALPGRKPEVLAAFDSYALAELLLQPENIIDRLQRLDLVGLLLIDWLISAGSKGLSPADLDKKLSTAIPWLSDEQRQEALSKIRYSALIGFPDGGSYRCWPEIITARDADSTSAAVNVQALLERLVQKEAVPVSDKDLSTNFGSGYEFLAALRELMRLLQLRPTKLRIDGLPVKSELDRIEPLLPVAIKDLVRPTIALLGQTRLTDTSEGQMVLTPLAEEFIRQEPAVEWSRLAAHWLSLFPETFQQALKARSTLSIPDLWRTLYPWPDTDLAKFSVTIEELTEIGVAIGLVSAGEPTELLYRFSTLSAQDRIIVPDGMSSGNKQAGDLHKSYPVISAHLDTLVLPDAKLYLQNDLSAVATGPLTHADDAKLSSFANKEAVGFAPSYRFSADSLHKAWRLGAEPEELRALLTRLAKNDAPLALEYLIDDSFQTARRIQVTTEILGEDRVTVITTQDELSIELLRRDPKLGTLKLQPQYGRLVSLQNPHIVSELLTNTGHPCTLILDPTTLDPNAEAGDATDAVEVFEGDVEEVPSVVQELWTRIQKEPIPDAKGQVLSSLEKRGSTHPPYWFTIVLQDNTEQRLQLQPLGLAAGRLRARDIVAETERTIPLRRVTKIEEIHESEKLGK